jgi:hypothetical protein
MRRGRIGVLLSVLFLFAPLYPQTFLPFAFPSTSDFLLVRTSEDQSTIGILNSAGQLCFRHSLTGRILGSYCFPPYAISDFRFASSTSSFVCFRDNRDNKQKILLLEVSGKNASGLITPKMDTPLDLQIIGNDLLIWGMSTIEYNGELKRIPCSEIHKLSYKAAPLVYPDSAMLKSLSDPFSGSLKTDELYLSLVSLMLRSYSQLEIPAFFEGTLLGASETADRKKDLPFHLRLDLVKITITKSVSEIRAYKDPVLPYYNVTTPLWIVRKTAGWLEEFPKDKGLAFLAGDKTIVTWNAQKHGFDTVPAEKPEVSELTHLGTTLVFTEGGQKTELPSALDGMQSPRYYFDEKNRLICILGYSPDGFILRLIDLFTLKTTSCAIKKPLNLGEIASFNVEPGNGASLLTIDYASQTDSLLRGAYLIKGTGAEELVSPKASLSVFPDFRKERLLCFLPASPQGPARFFILAFHEPEKIIFNYEYSANEMNPVMDFSPDADTLLLKDSENRILLFNYSMLTFREEIQHPLFLKVDVIRLIPSTQIVAIMSAGSMILFYDYKKHVTVKLLHIQDKWGFGIYDFPGQQYTWYSNVLDINTPLLKKDENLDFFDSLYPKK